MNIYLLSRIGNPDWDEYYGFVIAATNSAAARKCANDAARYDMCDWTDKRDATLTRIGEAARSVKAGVIMSDFKSGG